MASRIELVQERLAAHEVDAGLITRLTDIRWAVGFSGSNGILLVYPEDAHFVTDGRYVKQAQDEVEGAVVHTPGYKLYEHVQEAELLRGARRVLCQSDDLTVHAFERLEEQFPDVEWVPTGEFLTQAVASKSDDELTHLRKAQQITDQVFTEILSLMRPGVTEREIAAEIVYRHLKHGGDRMSFDPIVASGVNGSKPHARPTDRVLQRGELVTIDMGCFVNGYASDMTRTVAVGEPVDQLRNAYEVVRRAQETAVQSARAGMSSKALDNVAREIIADAGYGDYFSHGLGHGVGLNVHEWPRISYHTDDTLPDRAVVTIEPGVYLPDEFGIRIEDMIQLRADRCEVLTQSSKELTIV